MELSIEKTRITDVREGFDFLGYRVVQQPAHHTCNRVGKLFIPKSKLKQLRHKIKVKVKKTPTGKSLTDLIDSLNPIITGWRNYYRYAGRAWREFAKLDWWLERRVAHWARQKHRGARWNDLLRQYVGNRPGERRRWRDGTTQLRFFSEGGTSRFPDRGTPDTERMECRTQGVVPARSRSLLGGNQHPRQTHARATRGKRHAWRAGCRETRTSGSEWGMKKLVPAMG